MAPSDADETRRAYLPAWIAAGQRNDHSAPFAVKAS